VLDQYMVNTICTLYELREGDKVEGEGAPGRLHLARPQPNEIIPEFYQLDPIIFLNALAVLEKRGLAKVFSGTTKDSVGVKFFEKK